MTDPTLENIIRLQMAVSTAAVYLVGVLPDTKGVTELAAEIEALYRQTGAWLRGELRLAQSDELDTATKARIERLAFAHTWRELAIKTRTFIAKKRAPKGAAKSRKQVIDALTQEITACPVLQKRSA